MESVTLTTERPTMVASTLENTDAEMTDGSNFVEVLDALEKIQPNQTPPSDLVDTPAAVASLVDLLSHLPNRPPSIYVDIEGINLCRHGSISLIQIHVFPTNETYLVDVHTLKGEAFSTVASSGHTLKSIFESEAIAKAFFDIRNDSDALFSLYGIKVAGICDIQLMELATRSFSKRYISGLAKCIERDLPVTAKEQYDWKITKEKGVRLFDPQRGGSYELFNQRPLSGDIRDYCIQDVQLLPRLWQHYSLKMTQGWKRRVENATMDRIKLSQSANYNGKGRNMALGPW